MSNGDGDATHTHADRHSDRNRYLHLNIARGTDLHCLCHLRRPICHRNTNRHAVSHPDIHRYIHWRFPDAESHTFAKCDRDAFSHRGDGAIVNHLRVIFDETAMPVFDLSLGQCVTLFVPMDDR
jgi:hypothetical protein